MAKRSRGGVLRRFLVIGLAVGLCAIGSPVASAGAAGVTPATNGAWQSVAPLGSPLVAATAARLADGRIVVAGSDPNGGSGSPAVYDPGLDQWSALPPMPFQSVFDGSPVPLYGSAVGGDGRFYVFGGEGIQGQEETVVGLSIVQVYDPTADAWSYGPDMPAAANGVAGASLPDGRVLAIGGTDFFNSVSSVVQEFDPASSSWSELAPLPIACADAGAATGPDGLVYVVGGNCSHGVSRQLQIYDPATDTWTIGPLLPDARYGAGVQFGADGRLYVYGGNAGFNSPLATGYAYDPALRTWTYISSLPVATSELGSATLAGGGLLAIGGCAAAPAACPSTSVFELTPGSAGGSTPPDAPSLLSATRGNSVSVAFAPNGDGGSPITGYSAGCWSTDGGVPGSANGTASPIVVPGLTRLESYQCSVTASNAVGVSAPSGLSATFTVLALPSAPRSASAVPGNAAATVQWLPPVNNGGSPVTGYVVTPYINGVSQPPRTFAGAATTRTVSSLTNGKPYTFRVAARTAGGLGPRSGPTGLINVGAPTAPNYPVSVISGNGVATLKWNAPSNNNGSAITRYIITPYLGTVSQLPVREFYTPATTGTVTGLTNAKTYTFRVAAKNGRGVGPSIVTTALLVGAPTAPTALTATAGVKKATLHWTAPNANGAAITAYVVTPYHGGVALTPYTFASAATTETVTGLSSGQTYTFTVAAKNSRGVGAPSAMSKSVKPS